MLLTAWNTALSIAIEKLFEVRPHLPPVKWRSGWVYSVPEIEWEGDANRPSNFLAIHQRSKDEYDMHELLLNPVDTDGKIAYSLSDDQDLWRLMVRAIHETTHILHSPHNEDYTKLNDAITRELFPSDAIRRIRTAVKATSGLYKNAKYQALDNEPGPRPVESLSPNGVSIEGDRIRFQADDDVALDEDRRYG
jgi:hypothetical protein